jgi:hypothetical protein
MLSSMKCIYKMMIKINEINVASVMVLPLGRWILVSGCAQILGMVFWVFSTFYDVSYCRNLTIMFCEKRHGLSF